MKPETTFSQIWRSLAAISIFPLGLLACGLLSPVAKGVCKVVVGWNRFIDWIV